MLYLINRMLLTLNSMLLTYLGCFSLCHVAHFGRVHDRVACVGEHYSPSSIYGGQVVLIVLGRKVEDKHNGDLNKLFGLLIRSVQSLVLKETVCKLLVLDF